MKLAITAIRGTLDAEVDPRFGRARFFIVLGEGGRTLDVIDNSGAADLAHGAGIAAVETLVRRGVGVLVTGQVGPKAEQGLRAAGIETRTGASGSCRDALAALAPEFAAAATAADAGVPD